MNKYYENLQAAVRFFWWLIGIGLNYGIASEHFKYSAQKLYGALWCFCGFRGA